jgi:BTB/POZ domain-containing protein 9
VSKDIGRLLEDPSLCDVYLLVENRRIPAHKLILQARSAFFRRIFLEDPTLQELPLDVPLSLLNPVLGFIYTGQVQVTDGTALALLQVSKRYNLPDLVRLCECTLECTMDVSNAAALYELATLYEAKALRKACRRFIVNNLAVIQETETYKEMDEQTRDQILQRASSADSLSGKKRPRSADTSSS